MPRGAMTSSWKRMADSRALACSWHGVHIIQCECVSTVTIMPSKAAGPAGGKPKSKSTLYASLGRLGGGDGVASPAGSCV